MLEQPTTFLDIGHQLETQELVTRLNQVRNITIVMVLYDLNQAACYADRMIVLEQGRIVTNGAHKTVLTAERLRTVFVSKRTLSPPRKAMPHAPDATRQRLAGANCS